VTVHDLMTQAKTHGITLWTEGGTLRYRGDDSAISALLSELKAHKVELVEILSAERRIRAWLDRIGETDEEAIAEVLERCRNDPEARAYYLARATETEPRIHAVIEPEFNDSLTF
jgi:hypothetical protein